MVDASVLVELLKIEDLEVEDTVLLESSMMEPDEVDE